MEQDLEYRRSLMESYKKKIEPLFRYVTWLEAKRGQKVSSTYTGDDKGNRTMAFPVYDSTLLGFVKEVQRSGLTDRNYVYQYRHYRMETPAEELAEINNVTIKNVELLTGVLSRYVCEGMTKGRMWSLAVEEGIFLAILLKFKELFDLWDQPMEN